jgi:hypothetical protein
MVAGNKKSDMSSKWTAKERHCMHLLATHHQGSSWPDRAAVFNAVCAENLTSSQVPNEYGGHSAGRRRPGVKPTRSVMWNDVICRDEFNLPDPFTH